MNEVGYERSQEIAAIGRYLDEVWCELRNTTSWRNECFKVALSGKDSDLEPTGCVGIQEVMLEDDCNTLVAVIRGHRAIFDHEEHDEYDCDCPYENAEELVKIVTNENGDFKDDAVRLLAACEEMSDWMFR